MWMKVVIFPRINRIDRSSINTLLVFFRNAIISRQPACFSTGSRRCKLIGRYVTCILSIATYNGNYESVDMVLKTALILIRRSILGT